MLPAFKKYTETHNDTLLILAGPDDGYQAETERFIAEHHLQDKMIMVGMLTGEAKKAALSDADIFTLPSYSEGFSIAALEAMTAGVPSLVSDRIGFDGTVAKYNAAHEAPLTVEGVYEGLVTMLQNPKYGQKLAQKAQKMVWELYDINIVAGNLAKEFEKISRKAS